MAEEKVVVAFPSETIDLPSKGYLYAVDNVLKTGTIELKYPTAKEEDILTSQNLIKKGIVVDEFLKALIVDKSINFDNILIGDKNAIMVAARILAYGAQYPVKLKCDSCGKEFENIINLTSFENEDLNEEIFIQNTNSFEFTLPKSKIKITGKLLTHADQNKINSTLKRMSQLDGASHEITTRLKYIITSINDDTSSKRIHQFVEGELLSQDSLKLRSYLSKITPNINMNSTFTCQHCGHEMEGEVPLSTSFFWPES